MTCLSQCPREARAARYGAAERFAFGDSEALCARLLGLVRAGPKRATCWPVDQTPPPAPGTLSIATDWHGSPELLLRTSEIRQVRFIDMPEAWALLEGENQTLAGWRADHAAFFRRAGVFDPLMPLWWERFEVVEDFAEADRGLASRKRHA